MVNTVIAIITAAMIIAYTTPTATDFPLINLSYRVRTSFGTEEIMLNRSTIEIPFPTPYVVICSPIHISIALPAVMVTTATITLPIL